MAQVLGIGGVFFKSNKVELWQPPDPTGAESDVSDV